MKPLLSLQIQKTNKFPSGTRTIEAIANLDGFMTSQYASTAGRRGGGGSHSDTCYSTPVTASFGSGLL